jgi:hypothetical protein
MARTALPIESAPGSSPLTSEALTWTAADTANGNQFTLTGRELLLVRNVGAGTHTVTFQTVAVDGRQDPLHNTAINITAGAYVLFGDFELRGFRQSDGKLYVSANHAEIEFLVIRVRS